MRHLIFSEAGYDHINEDFVRAQFHPHDREMLVGVLADGQGGQFGGAAAARLSTQKCLELALTRSPAELLERQTWREIICAADKFVEADGDAGFTTLVALCATESQICGASCGDSAALLVEAGNSRELTSAQRKNPPVGSGAATPIAFAAARLATSPLLLVSDGVWKAIGIERIAHTARSYEGSDLVLQLREFQLATKAGKLADDFSILAVW